MRVYRATWGPHGVHMGLSSWGGLFFAGGCIRSINKLWGPLQRVIGGFSKVARSSLRVRIMRIIGPPPTTRYKKHCDVLNHGNLVWGWLPRSKTTSKQQPALLVSVEYSLYSIVFHF